jgi:hypothetical protein
VDCDFGARIASTSHRGDPPPELPERLDMRLVFESRRRLAVASAVLVVVIGTTLVHAQRRFEFYLLPFTEDGKAVVDLKVSELHYREANQEGNVVSVEPYRWPVKLTVLVDNGAGGAGGVGGAGRDFFSDDSASTVGSPTGIKRASDSFFDNTVQFRQGLKKLFEQIPRDIEVTLIATAPNPRYMVRPTNDPVQIAKGVDLIVPDQEFVGRFTDGLTEYTERLEQEFKGLSKEQRPPYLPVLISIGSSGLDGSRIEKERTERMLNSLHKWGVQTHFIMMTPKTLSDVPENEGGTVLIAHMAKDVTGGSYDSITSAAATRLMTLLPEIGKRIAGRHLKQTFQYRVTVDRPEGLTGPFGSDTGISLSRTGVRYLLSPDGSYP